MRIQIFEYDTISCCVGEEPEYDSVFLTLANVSYGEAEAIMELAKSQSEIKVIEDRDNE